MTKVSQFSLTAFRYNFMKFKEMATLNNTFMSSAEIKHAILLTKEDTWNKITHWKLNRLLVLQHTRATIMKYLCNRHIQAHAYHPFGYRSFFIFKILKTYAIKYLHTELHLSLNEM